jgi:hypothetical protein
MLKNIDVRFFFTGYDDDANLYTHEIDHQEFVDRYSEEPHARIDVELHSVYANGVRQLCITMNEVGW